MDPDEQEYISVDIKNIGNGLLDQVDMAFPIIHGTYGEDGSLQGLLEHMQLPYIGCNVLAASTTMDKVTSKLILKSSDVPVVDGIWFTTDDWLNNYTEKIKLAEDKLGFPMIVKPADTGSSVGVTVVKDKAELEDGVNFVRQFTNRILIEKLVQEMREINISVLGDCEHIELSVCEEPILSSEFLSYDDKYTSGGGKSKGMSSAKREIPAKLSDDQRITIEKMAAKAFRVLDCSGVVRIDLMIEGTTGNIYINELYKTLAPDAAIAALIAHEATHADYDYYPQKWIDLTLQQHPELTAGDLHIPGNSIDQEYNAFKDQVAVWNQTKNGLTDPNNDGWAQVLAQGEAFAKAEIQQVYLMNGQNLPSASHTIAP